MRHHPHDPSNVEALELFWRRRTFHDMAIEEVSALNKRVIIRLSEFTLIVTGVTSLKRCELPADWLYHTVTEKAGGFRLDVETTDGHLTVSGVDVRLIRNSDLAMLIPPVDA
jgi:hypothetical protein